MTRELWASRSEEIFGTKLGDVPDGHTIGEPDAIRAAELGLSDIAGEVVYIGFSRPIPTVELVPRAYQVVEQMAENLSELIGEAGDGWAVRMTDEDSSNLETVIAAWFDRNGMGSTQFQIVDVKSFEITDDIIEAGDRARRLSSLGGLRERFELDIKETKYEGVTTWWARGQVESNRFLSVLFAQYPESIADYKMAPGFRHVSQLQGMPALCNDDGFVPVEMHTDLHSETDPIEACDFQLSEAYWITYVHDEDLEKLSP